MAEEVVLVVLALEDRVDVATRVLEDVIDVVVLVRSRSAMVSESSIVSASAPTSDPPKTSSNIPDIGEKMRAEGAKRVGMIEMGKVT